MNRVVPPIVLLATLVGLLVGWQYILPAEAPRNTAHPFSVRTLDGRTVRLADLHGHPVVLDFWATWCQPCRASMPHLSAMQDQFGGRGLVVLGLSVDDGAPQTVQRFAERLRVRFPVAMASESMLDDYGPIRSVPTTIFIDRKGHIVRRVVGYVDRETLEGFIREIL